MLVGRYFPTQNVRSGAQATVTQAFDTKRSQMVAIKRVRFGPDDERGKVGFHREANLLQNLRHPNIVELIEVDQDEDGNWFLVLEWLDLNLEDVIRKHGPMTVRVFWDQFGERLLEAIAFGHKERVAHRDIKPKNILVSGDDVPKLADYGIAKLLDNGGSWAPVAGHTFRFDRTPGYAPGKPEENHPLTRDCYAFAAVLLSCVTGRCFEDDADLTVALQEAALSPSVRPIIERCLSDDARQRPHIGSLLLEQLRHGLASDEGRDAPPIELFLRFNEKTLAALRYRLDVDDRDGVERFAAEELAEACGIAAKTQDDGTMEVEIIGGSWRFHAIVAGREQELLHVTKASEIGAAAAADMKEFALVREVQARFVRPRDERRAGQQLSVLLTEARDVAARIRDERSARATQRVFRVWRGYLRDRADREAKRSSAIKYVDRKASGDRVTFTTEIAQSDDLIGQERIAVGPTGKVGGRISAVAFDLVTMDVTHGDARLVPRRGELSINTIAAQKALSHQTHALDAVVFDRAVSPRLKSVILDPRSASTCEPVEVAAPSDPELDEEKLRILGKALGVGDVLTIEGPPGTGKTKLITEIVVQWLRRNPGHRVLLSSQTHVALDNVLERVTSLDPGLEVIRVGRSDEPRISEASKRLLLERRVEGWITDVRKLAEDDMNRWAAETGVDRAAVTVGMRVEHLLQLRRRQDEVTRLMATLQAEREEVRAEAEAPEVDLDGDEAEDEATQLDSEIGDLQRRLAGLRKEERDLRTEMRGMGGYAAELAASGDVHDLADWAAHFMEGGEEVQACRDRLALLEDWQLRVGRSSDFNAAMLSSAQIIAGTCVGIAGVRGMEEVAYDLCIVDEASKATATEILIPMARSKRWIIVGDPKQLPPFFENLGEELLEAFDEREVKETLLDRFLQDGDGLPDGCRERLRHQYRMVKPIGDLVSACFYDGGLVSPTLTHGLKLGLVFPKPVTWFTTHALADHDERPHGDTFHNPCEVSAVRKLLLKLQFVASSQNARLSVAVLSGYTKQVQELEDMISRGIAEWPGLDVSSNTVDAYQGRQADVCIYSVVRSNRNGKLGFLKEHPRLNVALSRGRSALAIVGDQEFCRTAKGKNPFAPVLRHIDANDATCATEAAS